MSAPTADSERLFAIRTRPGLFFGMAAVMLAALARARVEQLAEILVLPARRLEIEHEVLDAETEIIERILQFCDGFPHSLVTILGLGRELLQMLAQPAREGPRAAASGR